MTEFVNATLFFDYSQKVKYQQRPHFTSAAECHSSILRDLSDFKTVQMEE